MRWDTFEGRRQKAEGRRRCPLSAICCLLSAVCCLLSAVRGEMIMKRLLLALAIALPMYAGDGAAILAKVDAGRNPLNSFSADVAIPSTSGSETESSRFLVYGKGSDRSVVEFVAPATEKAKFLLMLRDAMWIYMPATSRPIRISPLQRLMGQASNGDVARTNFAVDYN